MQKGGKGCGNFPKVLSQCNIKIENSGFRKPYY